MPSHVFTKKFLPQFLLNEVVGLLSLLLPTCAQCHDSLLEEIIVVGDRVHNRQDASSGALDNETLNQLPLLRSGDILEAIPGLIATQHSGSGKANQYFLRGFNLDHGTDFSTRIDFMPVNLRSHCHGQGYTDLNFIIPELIERLDYRKGPYYVDSGDFTGTGSAHMHTATIVPDEFTQELGENGYRRSLIIENADIGMYHWLLGGEYQTHVGNWDSVNEDIHKKNLWLKFSTGTPQDGTDVLFMAYDNHWNSADQIPARAVNSGLISPYGSLDNSDGGVSNRYSLSAQKRWQQGEDQWFASGYVIAYSANLWSNFTYFTQPQGDQFEQQDHRKLYGGDWVYSHSSTLATHVFANTFGVQIREDNIDALGLYPTQHRQPYGTTRKDAVLENSTALYWQGALQLSANWRSISGLRYDNYRFNVEALDASNLQSLEANSGNKRDGIITGSQKWVGKMNANWEAFAALGRGFHSNDARGVTSHTDPISGREITPADPLVPINSAEIGVQGSSDILDWQGSLALWYLDIGSELIFLGDAGSTENTGIGSHRHGIELTSQMAITPALYWQLEYSISASKLNAALDGDENVPGALPQTLVSQWLYKPSGAWECSLRLRYFDRYSLGAGATAAASQILNAGIQFSWHQHKIRLDAFNLLNSHDHDIEYYYPSQLSDEIHPIDDHHYHLFEPRQIRLGWRMLLD